jgi:membrane associated rhomboid family serine protease
VDTEGDRFVLKILGVIVGIAFAGFALWWLVDLAWYAWGAIGALIFAFLFVFLLFYLADRRKIKESEDLIAERSGLG